MLRFHRKYAGQLDLGLLVQIVSVLGQFWICCPEVKYAPKLVELISNNFYGMVMAYIS